LAPRTAEVDKQWLGAALAEACAPADTDGDGDPGPDGGEGAAGNSRGGGAPAADALASLGKCMPSVEQEVGIERP